MYYCLCYGGVERPHNSVCPRPRIPLAPVLVDAVYLSVNLVNLVLMNKIHVYDGGCIQDNVRPWRDLQVTWYHG